MCMDRTVYPIDTTPIETTVCNQASYTHDPCPIHILVLLPMTYHRRDARLYSAAFYAAYSVLNAPSPGHVRLVDLLCP